MNFKCERCKISQRDNPADNVKAIIGFILLSHTFVKSEKVHSSIFIHGLSLRNFSLFAPTKSKSTVSASLVSVKKTLAALAVHKKSIEKKKVVSDNVLC